MPATKRSHAARRPEEFTPAEFPKLKLPVVPPYQVMEARTAVEVPEGKGWVYEPKWDGFRCLAFRDGQKLVLQSKAGQPLGRYFPELVQVLLQLSAQQFVLDGEIVIEVGGHLDFDALLQRIHPAESRIKKLSRETASQFLVFDILVDADKKDLTPLPLHDRKDYLKRFVGENLKRNRTIRMSQFSPDLNEAKTWLTDLADFGCDGIIAKLKDEPYHSGDRDAMYKIKRMRTADCVIGGFRYATKKEKGIGSLLLGLYNSAGQLDHVGFCSSFTAQQRLDLIKELASHRAGSGFTGKAPGGPSRWNRSNEGRSSEWEPLDNKLVVEVQYDHMSNGRFRHGTKFLRWRPEKAPKQCTFEQLRVTKKPHAA
jgi:ATP-dependent DNA ligase